ncbi:MAG: hypothetical protein AAF628_26305 [Planctomycetota bacterium]
MSHGRWLGVCAVAVAFAGGTAAQASGEWTGTFGYLASTPKGNDYVEFQANHGVFLANAGFEIRADRALLWVDSDLAQDLESENKSSPLPRRDALPPVPRRTRTEALLAARLRAFARAAGVTPPPGRMEQRAGTAVALRGLRHLYLEGEVAVEYQGREVATAQRAYLSLPEDRLVLHGGQIRFSLDGDPPRTLVLRGEKIVRQGPRTTGRNVSVTSCTAGEPHFDVRVDQIEVIQRDDDFEVVTKGNTLAIGGQSLIPLPNARFNAREQSQIPLRGASIGHNGQEGVIAQVDFGGSMNDVGGSVHEWLTGRPAHEFRGDWLLGVGYNQKRGHPLEADLNYRGEGLYTGRTQGYFLDDQGRDRREILRLFDGTPITQSRRNLLRTENRIFLGEDATLDLTAFSASDPAVWSEFFPADYRQLELPETSAHFRLARDNRLLTATARANINRFSYAADRSLAPFFVEELPLVTYDWFSEPLLTLPGDAPLLLTTSSNAGYLRRAYDATSVVEDDSALRLDQEIELSVPFRLGPIGVRPFVAASASYYDDSPMDRDELRTAAAVGARAATRISRTWSWLDGENGQRALRHVMSPAVAWIERFHVSDSPQDFFQFDPVDALTERTEIRLELLNRVQQRRGNGPPTELLWLDLAQTLTPISSRDNNGHHLGLFEYELIVRPDPDTVVVPNLRLLVEGEHDWNTDDLNTFNTGVRFGKVLGLDWRGEFRTDAVTKGAIGYGASTDVFGRWSLAGNTQYDLQLKQTLNYSLQVLRRDHDWRLSLGIVFDDVINDTRFFINFEPSLGGLLRPRNHDYLSGSALYGGALPGF